MTQNSADSTLFYGPDNSESEIRKAYNCVIDTGVGYFWDRRAIPGVNADEVVTLYKHSMQCYQQGNRLAAERWARTVKHLARAFWHEAKITFLEPRVGDLPYLEGGQIETQDPHGGIDATSDLLECAAQCIPAGMGEVSEQMRRYLNRGMRHLKALISATPTHDLLRVERIKAAYEYGRVLECMILAYEAESQAKTAA